MNAQEALHVLSENQPLPEHPGEARLAEFREALRAIYDDPWEEAIPLLFGAFGEWEELTLYDCVQTVLHQFTWEQVRPHLLAGLRATRLTVRQWSADTARYFPHPDLVPAIEPLLFSDNAYSRLVAAAALECIGGSEVRRLAAGALASERDEDVLEILSAILHQGALPGPRPR